MTSIERTASHRSPALAVATIVVAIMMLALPGQAFAHTAFDSSSPADGDVVDAPVEVVTITFTNPAEPAGDEFRVLDGDGTLRTPAEVTTIDGRAFDLRFDPPLAGGDIGVRWQVRAGDAHPIDGSFTFTVTAASDDGETPTGDVATSSVDDSSTPAPASLDDFLATPASTPGESLARAGRTVEFLGATIGIGALAFLATALRGRRSEVRWALTAVRALGAVIVVGAAIEYLGVARLLEESTLGALSTSAGFASVLRLVGGLALALGLAATITPVRRTRPARALSAAVVEPDSREVDAERTATSDDDTLVRWRPDRASWPAFVGVGLVVVSFWFDGHTVTKGVRPLHAVVNSVHLLAGSIWVGGVVLMAAVIWKRSRAGRATRAAELAVRFSPIATLSLVAVALAGVLMTVFVMDSFGELTGTEWGQILLLKVAAVGLAAVGGAYNHFRLVPALDADPDGPELLDRLRATVTAEAILLVFVVIVTAVLVAAAS